MVLVSGGADSMTMLTGLVGVLPAGDLFAVHVNYGLRPEAGADEALVRARCAELGVDLTVLAAGRPEGNVQAWAREIRFAEAERVRSERACDWVAVGHTLTDQAETVLYRLVSSPGARSLIAMSARDGRIVRPLLKLSRDEVRRIAETGGIPFRDDATNRDPTFARNRIRNLVMPELERINPAAEANLVRTRDELEEDEEYLMGIATGIVASVTRGGPAGGFPAAILTAQPPALRRRVLRALAEEELGRPVAVGRRLADDAARLAGDSEGGRLDLGQGDRLVFESGYVRVAGGDARGPSPVPVPLLPGTTRFGEWSLEFDEVSGDEARGGFGEPWTAFFDPRVTEAIQVRARRRGDRIELLGSTGAKRLQDVFVDGRAPRGMRDGWPVVLVGDEVVWVPGLAVSRHHLLEGEDDRAVRLRATAPPAP